MATVTVHVKDVDNRPPWFQPCLRTNLGIAKLCVSTGYRGKVNLTEKEVSSRRFSWWFGTGASKHKDLPSVTKMLRWSLVCSKNEPLNEEEAGCEWIKGRNKCYWWGSLAVKWSTEGTSLMRRVSDCKRLLWETCYFVFIWPPQRGNMYLLLFLSLTYSPPVSIYYNLISLDQGSLAVCRFRLKTKTDCAFVLVAPTLRNSLLSDLRSVNYVGTPTLSLLFMSCFSLSLYLLMWSTILLMFDLGRCFKINFTYFLLTICKKKSYWLVQF